MFLVGLLNLNSQDTPPGTSKERGIGMMRGENVSFRGGYYLRFFSVR